MGLASSEDLFLDIAMLVAGGWDYEDPLFAVLAPLERDHPRHGQAAELALQFVQILAYQASRLEEQTLTGRASYASLARCVRPLGRSV